jgi:hypothetical protein
MISVHVMSFDRLEKEKDDHNMFHFSNVKAYEKRFEDFEIHFNELEKFKKGIYELDIKLDLWTNFFSYCR